MKNINQIFKNNKHLMDEPEVIELVEYTRELEEIVLQRKIEDSYEEEGDANFPLDVGNLIGKQE